MSNLPFVAKVVEQAVIGQLLTHCTINAPLSEEQSSYRAFYSTETALARDQSAILMAMGRQKVPVLVLLALNATFDTIDHGILLSILENDYGVVGHPQR